MYAYIARRLLLLPITLFCILLINFVIINLAPGEPTTATEISQDGAARREKESGVAASDEQYLQFREFYGLTLPVLLNFWPWTTSEEVETALEQLSTRRYAPGDKEEMPVKKYNALRVLTGDKARFVMPLLLSTAENDQAPRDMRTLAVRFFVRGATRQGIVGQSLSPKERAYNRKVAYDNQYLRTLLIMSKDSAEELDGKVNLLKQWYQENRTPYHFEPGTAEKLKSLFFETRLSRYMSRVLLLDFGTVRGDPNKSVISEVAKRFKYSFTLAIMPMGITFVLCQLFGILMAVTQNRWPDHSLNFLFLVLYATPVFVAAPFLIEKVALNHYFPFTDTPIPISGFTSPPEVYEMMTSKGRLLDVLQHILLPIAAIMYGSLAAQTRLSRTAVLEVLRQDYVRTAWAKGLPRLVILFRHVGRNAAITIVTSLAGSLSVILGGSLIAETIFGIDGFGRFFYEAIINRDYNVIMFSAIAGSVLTLAGYLAADIAYTLLDPRVTLD